jgi:hypothetical protein
MVAESDPPAARGFSGVLHFSIVLCLFPVTLSIRGFPLALDLRALSMPGVAQDGMGPEPPRNQAVRGKAKRKGAVKLCTLLDLRGNLPTVCLVPPGTAHDVNMLDRLTIELGSFEAMQPERQS